jgi:NitT/TauT family transport system permease protein
MAEAIEETGGKQTRTLWSRLRTLVWFLGIVGLMAFLYEAYKAMWEATNGTIPVLGVDWLVRGNDITMPHTWSIIATLFDEVQRGSNEILLVDLIKASLFTLREALVGFFLGATFGFGLGVLFVRFPLAERSFMPYVVASQTVPILAIAPIVVIWGRRFGVSQWMAVAIIAAYLTFFPVVINTLRGLRSPQATASELMRSYAASHREVLLKLQIPAAVPYIFTALKVSATASVIGAIIGELPAGFPNGLGRKLLVFSQRFASGPEKLYGTVLVAAAAGFLFVWLVGVVERWLIPTTRRVAS